MMMTMMGRMWGWKHHPKIGRRPLQPLPLPPPPPQERLCKAKGSQRVRSALHRKGVKSAGANGHYNVLCVYFFWRMGVWRFGFQRGTCRSISFNEKRHLPMPYSSLHFV